MQQVAGRQRFWWRALDAQTPEPNAAWYLDASSSGARLVPSEIPRAARPAMRLQVPRGERRFRGLRRRGRGWGRPALLILSVSVAAAAAALALPFDRLRFADVGSAFNVRLNELMIAVGFGIDQVNLSGQYFAADSDIFDALDLLNVRTFAAFDSDAALKRIERIPWVDNAQITRVYPSTLDIIIRERVPSAIWTRGDKSYLIDATGRVLGPLPAAGGWALPRVAGEGANTEATLLLAALRQYPALERDYAYAERIAERRWRIVLRNGSALELGADREIEGLEELADIRALRSVLSGKAMIVDVRTPGRITVRPAGPSARTAALATTLASGQP